MKVDFQLDLREFSRDIHKVLAQTSGHALGEAAIAGILLIRELVKDNIRYQGLVDTAALLNSWIYKLERASRTKAEAWTATDRVYARIHEFGGVIRPKTANALRFQTKDGNWVITQSVTIPARPYVRPALDENKEAIASAIIHQLQANVDGALRG